MIQSLLVYTLSALILYKLGLNASIRDKYLLKRTGRGLSFFSFEIIASIIFFACLSGVRYNVGVDHLSYLHDYLDMQKLGHFQKNDFELLYVYISKIFAAFNLHFFYIFAFWAALQIGFIYYALRNKKYLLPYVGLCIMLGSYYLNWMNGIRQCIVMCAFVWSIELIEKKKFWPYTAFILIATTMHKSAIILLPIYFLLNYSPVNWIKDKNRNLIIVLVCVLIGNIPTWLHILNSLDEFLIMIGYTNYGNRIEEMTSENLRDTAWGPSRISLFLINIIIIWFYPKMRQYYKQKSVDYYFLLFFIGTCAYNLFVNTSHIFLRPVEYFTIFTLPLSAFLLYYLKKIKNKLLFNTFLILACSNTYIVLLKTYILYNPKMDSYFFKFFWNYPINY